MDRFALIRGSVGLVAGASIGLAFANACIYIVTAASLGLFLSFLVWLLGMLATLAASLFASNVITSVVTNERIDAALAKPQAWVKSLRARVGGAA